MSFKNISLVILLTFSTFVSAQFEVETDEVNRGFVQVDSSKMINALVAHTTFEPVLIVDKFQTDFGDYQIIDPASSLETIYKWSDVQIRKSFKTPNQLYIKIGRLSEMLRDQSGKPRLDDSGKVVFRNKEYVSIAYLLDKHGNDLMKNEDSQRKLSHYFQNIINKIKRELDWTLIQGLPFNRCIVSLNTNKHDTAFKQYNSV